MAGGQTARPGGARRELRILPAAITGWDDATEDAAQPELGGITLDPAGSGRILGRPPRSAGPQHTGWPAPPRRGLNGTAGWIFGVVQPKTGRRQPQPNGIRGLEQHSLLSGDAG